MNKYILSVLLLLSCSTALAQEHLTGEVRYSGSKEKASGVNVIVRSQGKLLGYDITGDDGEFCIDYDSAGMDSVAVSVTGFEVKQMEITVPCNSGRLTLVVQQEKQTIREVKVTAPAIKRQSDTLTYYVENFRAENDRSIGDVLKKLPGIQVEQSGEIKYNGKSINKFYIEGLDMLGGKYGVATNNVQAKDVASIEVYEDHQPIKLLQDWVKSDRAAINLRLKEKAKGTWNVLLKGGLGYKPLQWDVEASPMYFGGRFQTISTYKANNVGKDVSRELESLFGNEDMMENILNVSMPQLPPFDESRYLSNNIHVVSTNILTKLSEDADVTAGVNYVHDLQNSAGRTSTMYYIPGESPLVIDEIIEACDKKDILGIDLQFRNNSRTSYMLDYISFEGQWQSRGSGIYVNGDEVSQKLSGPKFRLMNQLQYAKIVGKWNLTFESVTSWKRLSSDFVVSPTPFSSFLGKGNPEMSAVQGLDAWVFSTDNRFNAYRKVGNWTFSLTGAMGLWHEDMQSSLSGGMPDEQPVQPADSLKNSIESWKFDVKVGPSLTYGRKWLVATLSTPLDLMSIWRNDRIAGSRFNRTSLLFSPSLSVLMNLTYRLKLNLYGNMVEDTGSIFDSYGGYIMSGYRTLGKYSGLPKDTRRQMASMELKYADDLNGLFASASCSWYRNKDNISSGIIYDGDVMVISSDRTDNIAQTLTAKARISKRIPVLASTVSLSGVWNRSWNEYIRQNTVVPSSYDRITAGLELYSKIGRSVSFIYEGQYACFKKCIGSTTMEPINCLAQEVRLGVSFAKAFSIQAGLEHYFNDSINGKDRNMLFADASLSYKRGRFEYMIEAHNLTNSKAFSSFAYNDIMSYCYTTTLRPLAVMLTLRFSLR